MLTLHPGSQGGGVYVQSGGVANFNYCTIYENTASVSVRACSLNLPELSAIAPLKLLTVVHVCVVAGGEFPANRTHV